VVKLARKLGAEAVLGNHDAHVLKHHRGEAVGPHHTEVAKSLTVKDFEYLAGLPLWLDVPRHQVRVVHAGLVPGVKVEAQRPEELINMRSLDAQGQPRRRVSEGVPWASKWQGPELAVFGHDAMRGLQEYPLALGLGRGDERRDRGADEHLAPHPHLAGVRGERGDGRVELRAHLARASLGVLPGDRGIDDGDQHEVLVAATAGDGEGGGVGVPGQVGEVGSADDGHGRP
jgi:hypothetical protein